MIQENELEINTLSQRNLHTAMKIVEAEKDAYKLNMYGEGICITFVHRLFNDIAIRGCNFDDKHFQTLSERFDEISKKYQAKTPVKVSQIDNANQFCKAVVVGLIFTLKNFYPSIFENVRLNKHHKQLARILANKN